MNPLDAILDWYQTARDALRVTVRVISRHPVGIVADKHVFHGAGDAENLTRLGVATKQLDQLAVLALVAVFERALRDYVVSVLQGRCAAVSAVEMTILDHVRDDAEFWNFSSRLIDVFDNVQADVRGRVKQFVDLRNWVAHGHHAGAAPEPAPIRVLPRDVYQVLTSFLQQAALI